MPWRNLRTGTQVGGGKVRPPSFDFARDGLEGREFVRYLQENGQQALVDRLEQAAKGVVENAPSPNAKPSFSDAFQRLQTACPYIQAVGAFKDVLVEVAQFNGGKFTARQLNSTFVRTASGFTAKKVDRTFTPEIFRAASNDDFGPRKSARTAAGILACIVSVKTQGPDLIEMPKPPTPGYQQAG